MVAAAVKNSQETSPRKKVGGARPGSGRKPVTGFREFARRTVMDPEVLAAIAGRAKVDPEYALKLAEAGFGRPPQALDVAFSGPSRIEVAFGAAAHAVGLDDE